MSLPETNIDLIISKNKEIIQQAQAALERGREILNSTGMNVAVDFQKMTSLLSVEQKKMMGGFKLEVQPYADRTLTVP
ncbi:hypothetical protein HC248_00202 [Polaromonas vacuolata]|uniref:Uncharacterized protein n=1 Tax=Polaromonas vacuolata TaxID=37448 RepID=A0A6H2H505_9BURK|nr:hypothetical protein [Polaromonas vacuolata]QJC54939.1 hypothetical protein HC248_00202 [Polaromonas vacuolata]